MDKLPQVRIFLSFFDRERRDRREFTALTTISRRSRPSRSCHDVNHDAHDAHDRFTPCHDAFTIVTRRECRDSRPIHDPHDFVVNVVSVVTRS